MWVCPRGVGVSRSSGCFLKWLHHKGEVCPEGVGVLRSSRCILKEWVFSGVVGVS